MRKEVIPDVTSIKLKNIEVEELDNKLMIRVLTDHGFRESTGVYVSEIDLTDKDSINILKVYDRSSSSFVRKLYSKTPWSEILIHAKDVKDRLWWGFESNMSILDLKNFIDVSLNKYLEDYTTRHNKISKISLIQTGYKIDLPDDSVKIYISDKFNNSVTGLFDHRKFLQNIGLTVKSDKVKFIKWSKL